MAAPTPEVRKGTYDRDGNRCVCCGSSVLSFQHRRAVGAGGSKTRPTFTDGLTLCPVCNAACEAHFQSRALANGWKVPRWVKDPARVPIYYPHEFAWYRLTLDGTRERIGGVVALDMMLDVYGEAEYFRWRAAA